MKATVCTGFYLDVSEYRGLNTNAQHTFQICISKKVQDNNNNNNNSILQVWCLLDNWAWIFELLVKVIAVTKSEHKPSAGHLRGA